MGQNHDWQSIVVAMSEDGEGALAACNTGI